MNSFPIRSQRLLRASGDENILGFDLDAVTGQVPRDHFAQWFIALGGAVLQRLVAPQFEHPAAGFLETVQGKHIRSGQATGKRNHLRLFGEFQQFADGRALKALGTLRISGLPRCGHGFPPVPLLKLRDSEVDSSDGRH